MKYKLLIVLILTTVMVTAQNIEQEKEAIRKVIQTAYVEGLQNEGNIEKIDFGIHPDFELLGVGENNNMWKYSITDWKIKTLQKVKDGELPRKGEQVTVEFKTIDVTGTAAMVKINLLVGKKLAYVDYISLYKFKDGWKMVNKIFQKM
ncbi:MAG: nuclear transport factor 2 family protein [Bacteroidota bacterium]